MNSNYTKTRVDNNTAVEPTVETNTVSGVDIGQTMHEYNLPQYIDMEICNKVLDDILKLLSEQTKPVTSINAMIACMTLMGLLVLEFSDHEARKCCAKVVQKIADE